MVIQFSTCYAKDGMTAVTLQMAEQKFRYVVDDIAQQNYKTLPLEIPVSSDLYDEIVRMSERCWPYTEENLWVVKFGFYSLSNDLKTLLNNCWQNIFETEEVLHYRLKSSVHPVR